MDIKKLFQIRLSTLLLLMLVMALSAILISNLFTIRALQEKVETYENRLPEFDIVEDLESLESELEEARVLNGDSSPVVRNLEDRILALKRRLNLEATRAEFQSRHLKKN